MNLPMVVDLVKKRVAEQGINVATARFDQMRYELTGFGVDLIFELQSGQDVRIHIAQYEIDAAIKQARKSRLSVVGPDRG